MNYQTQNNWSGLEIFLLRIMLTSVSCWYLWMCISVFHKSNVSRTARIGLLMEKKQPETRCLMSLSTLNGPASQHSGRVRLLLRWVAVKADRVQSACRLIEMIQVDLLIWSGFVVGTGGSRSGLGSKCLLVELKWTELTCWLEAVPGRNCNWIRFGLWSPIQTNSDFLHCWRSCVVSVLEILCCQRAAVGEGGGCRRQSVKVVAAGGSEIEGRERWRGKNTQLARVVNVLAIPSRTMVGD